MIVWIPAVTAIELRDGGELEKSFARAEIERLVLSKLTEIKTKEPVPSEGELPSGDR